MFRTLRGTTVLIVLLAALAAFGCARRTQTTTAPEAFPAPTPVAVATPAPRPAPTPAPVAAAPTPAPVAPAPGPGGVTVATPAQTPTLVRRSRLDTIYFDFDKSELKPESRVTLEANAEYLRANSALRIQIEGHCDERGSVQYNLALGERRAESARRYLESLGVNSTRLSTISYGKERPVDPGHDEEAWAKNRRAEFVAAN